MCWLELAYRTEDLPDAESVKLAVYPRQRSLRLSLRVHAY
jgi:hypothetical protein